MCKHISKVLYSFLDIFFHETHAFSWFADNVLLVTDHELVCAITWDVLSAFISGLGIHGPDGL
jgi:hypothetical protein